MSRDDGFAIADVDSGLLSDPKVVALARRLKDPVRTASTVMLYVAAVLESWASGELASIDSAAPAWWLDDVGEARADLEAVGLLDTDGRPTERAWEHWYRPAFDRREKRRQSGRLGGLASGHGGGSEPTPKQSPSNGQASLNPSVPTEPAGSPAEPARNTDSLARAALGERASEPPGRDGSCPGCGARVRDGAPNVAVVDRQGNLGHVRCPGDAKIAWIAPGPVGKAAATQVYAEIEDLVVRNGGA